MIYVVKQLVTVFGKLGCCSDCFATHNGYFLRAVKYDNYAIMRIKKKRSSRRGAHVVERGYKNLQTKTCAWKLITLHCFQCTHFHYLHVVHNYSLFMDVRSIKWLGRNFGATHTQLLLHVNLIESAGKQPLCAVFWLILTLLSPNRSRCSREKARKMMRIHWCHSEHNFRWKFSVWPHDRNRVTLH